MYRASEEIAEFRISHAVRDGNSHWMVIRKFTYESYCYISSVIWLPTTAIRPTCPKCSRVVISNDE